MKNLTQSEVFAAIKNFKLETGEEPNCQELLQYIGRGSMGTIHKYLTVWRSQSRNEYISSVANFKGKDGHENVVRLPEAIGEAWSQETSRLQQQMSNEIQALREANDCTVRLLEGELKMLRLELERQESEMNIKDKKIEGLKELLYRLSSDNAENRTKTNLHVVTNGSS